MLPVAFPLSSAPRPHRIVSTAPKIEAIDNSRVFRFSNLGGYNVARRIRLTYRSGCHNLPYFQNSALRCADAQSRRWLLTTEKLGQNLGKESTSNRVKIRY